MISRFRKHIAPQLSFTVGFLCLFVLAGAAQARVATRIQVASQKDGDVLTLTAKVADVEGRAVSEGSVSFETPKGSLGSVFVRDGAGNAQPDESSGMGEGGHGRLPWRPGVCGGDGEHGCLGGRLLQHAAGIHGDGEPIVADADTGSVRHGEPDGDFAERLFRCGQPVVFRAAGRFHLHV